jgi:hypothetical protein
MGGMMMMSDKKSKEEIKKLEGANEALSLALSKSSGKYPNTAAPSTGLQALGQQDTPPSHASFPDAPQQSPAAQRVAQQNAAMKPMAQPGQSDIRDPWAVNLQEPDLTGLDEAYGAARRNYGG